MLGCCIGESNRKQLPSHGRLIPGPDDFCPGLLFIGQSGCRPLSLAEQATKPDCNTSAPEWGVRQDTGRISP
jgi:hypothetical protein